MIRIKVLLLFLVVPISSFCQNNWQKLGVMGFDWPIRYLCADTNNNLLYASGNFEYVDGINVNQIAKWNGVNWDSLSHGEIAGGVVYAMTNYQNNFYACGNFLNDWNYSLGKWNGINWDTSGIQVYGAIYSFRENNGELYLGGSMISAGYIPVNFLTKYNGVNWTAFNTFNWSGFGVLALEFYNGELYCAGNFWDTANGISRLAKYDGVNFSSVGIGVMGQFAYVADMAIYQNELIIAGGFSTSQGNAGNCIMKWDGTNLTPVGTGIGTAYAINDIEVYGGYLYVVGDFTDIDGVPANHIARWDGSSWSAIGPEQFDNNISAIAFYQNQLYAGGGFKTIDGDTVNYIARYTGPLSVKEEKQNLSFNIYPNPVSDNLTIEISASTSEKKYLSIYNVLGKEVLKENFSSQKYSVNVSGLARGVYFVEVRNSKNILRGKFLKE